VEFRKEYENLLELYRRQYGENLTEEQLKKLNLKQVAVDNLINQAVNPPEGKGIEHRGKRRGGP